MKSTLQFIAAIRDRNPDIKDTTVKLLKLGFHAGTISGRQQELNRSTDRLTEIMTLLIDYTSTLAKERQELEAHEAQNWPYLFTNERTEREQGLDKDQEGETLI